MADEKNFRFTYQGTVKAFKATTLPSKYANEVVYITGDASGNGRAIFANGEYYANADSMSERGWRPMRMNGSNIYWGKIASVSNETITSGGRDAWIEVEVNGDTNFPNACRFIIQITQYLNSAISVAVFGGASPIPRAGMTGPKPCVTVDANRNVWLKILNAQWDMYAAIRPLKQDTFGTISILGKAVDDGGHASNFEMQIDAPASTFLEGYGGLRYTISSGTYTLTGAVIDATATDAKKLGGVDASGYAKTEELSGRKYIYVQGGLTDDQLIYALPTSKDGTEDDTLVSEMSLKTINGQSIIGEGDIPIDGGGSGHYYIAQTTLYELLFDEGLIALPQNDMQGILDALTSRKLVLFPDAFGIGTDTENNGYGVMLAGAAEDLLYFTVADTSGGVFAIEVVYPEGTIVSRKEIGLTIYNTKTINGELLVGTGDIKVAPVPYTIRSLAITELAVGESFENEIEYIKQAITSGTDIEIYTGNGYGKAKAIYQELDDYVYLSFCQMASVIYMEINMDTGEIEALQSTH